jgi:hypothetical protein
MRVVEMRVVEMGERRMLLPMLPFPMRASP